MVECQLPKLDVAGSSPVSRSMFSGSVGGKPGTACMFPLFGNPEADGQFTELRAYGGTDRCDCALRTRSR